MNGDSITRLEPQRKAWLTLHGGANRDCPRYQDRHPTSATQEEAIQRAKNTLEKT